jgi:hypothetical protein
VRSVALAGDVLLGERHDADDGTHALVRQVDDLLLHGIRAAAELLADQQAPARRGVQRHAAERRQLARLGISRLTRQQLRLGNGAAARAGARAGAARARLVAPRRGRLGAAVRARRRRLGDGGWWLRRRGDGVSADGQIQRVALVQVGHILLVHLSELAAHGDADTDYGVRLRIQLQLGERRRLECLPAARGVHHEQLRRLALTPDSHTHGHGERETEESAGDWCRIAVLGLLTRNESSIH